ncbi:hypothetical protein FA15DRAFT_319512 [Coprinopsis marcescibilis]|uniref:Virilizer N-terminal domain-containing protein n=1 Tax=Coprinopsis marcescibilis TaxID=230819 RepID=A0A5C3L096_COPMA|nr:hypothetical protein FA15DRAFT_319512 [Coprinopsis marcescibilis]
MSLLHCASLSPQGPSNLAAIRFSAPIRISFLRVYPKGSTPFQQAPDVVAETEPDAFFVDIFFNAQPLQSNPNPEPKEKQRAPNALVPTSIAYAGGQMDFAIDMGNEFATRLMIVKGNFKVLTMAIYGEIVAEQPPVLSYEPKPLPVVGPYPLSRVLDPANAADSEALAEKLLTLMPDSPRLSLVVRLMFCLKPSDEDWDEPAFPHLYADLENSDGDFDLEGIVNSASRPIRDDLPQDAFMTLVDRVNDFLGPKDNDQAYYIAKLLSIAAPQQPEMARVLLENIDLENIFDENTLDENTLLCILDACANRDIATHFNNNETLSSLFTSVQQSSTSADQYTRSTAGKVAQRLKGWREFELALTREDSNNFKNAIAFLVDITSEENSTGIWLSCMLLNDDLNSKINGKSSSSDAQWLPLDLIPSNRMTRSEFLLLVRAVVGVVSVLAVWAWADSLGNDHCRERILGILNLWQDVDGYKNILNHLLHLRQLTRRLGWIISDSDPPRKSGIFAERILSRLAESPQSMLQEELVKTVLNLKPPLSFITEDERLALRKIAYVVEDGVAAAVEELVFISANVVNGAEEDKLVKRAPLSARRLRTLRVSVAIVVKEVKGDEEEEGEGTGEGEWRVLTSLWGEQAHGLVPRLIDLLVDLAEDVGRYFEAEYSVMDEQRPVAVPAMSEVNYKLLAQLWDTAYDALGLVEMLVGGYPLAARDLRRLVGALVELCACSAVARDVWAAGPSVVGPGLRVRDKCSEVLKVLSREEMRTETGTLNALVVLRTVLAGAGGYEGAAIDPIIQLRESVEVVERLLPEPVSEGSEGDDYMGMDEEAEPETSFWVTSVLPKALEELKGFFQFLDLDTKLRLFTRLVKLDGGVTGLGEWVLVEHLKVLDEDVRYLAFSAASGDAPASQPVEDHRVFLRRQIVDAVEFLWDVQEDPGLGSWYRTVLVSDEEVGRYHLAVVDSFLDCRLTSSSLTRLVRALVKGGEASKLTPDFVYAILVYLLRIAQVDPMTPGVLDDCLRLILLLPASSFSEMADIRDFPLELGLTLNALARSCTAIDGPMASSIIAILEWALRHENRRVARVKGVKGDEFTTVCDFCSMLVPEKNGVMLEIRAGVSVDEDECFVGASVEVEDGLEGYAVSNGSGGVGGCVRMTVGGLDGLFLHKGQLQAGAGIGRPSTPRAGAGGTKTPDILGMVISPPTALLRSPAATGLTKTYARNDFRQLRQVPSARLNTSRLPSMHGA